MDHVRRARARRRMMKQKFNKIFGIPSKEPPISPPSSSPVLASTSTATADSPQPITPCPAADVPYVAPILTETTTDHSKRRGRARRLIICRSKVPRPVPPPPFPSVVARSESADIIPKCNCNYNFDRSAQLEEQANPIELHGEEEENTTDAFRQSPPPLDDMTEGSGDSDEAVNENEYEAVAGEDNPTTTGPGVLSTVKALLTAYDEETLYGTDYDEETVYDER